MRGDQRASHSGRRNSPLSFAALLVSCTYFGKKGRMVLPTLSRQLFHAHSSSSYFRDVAIKFVSSRVEGLSGLSPPSLAHLPPAYKINLVIEF